MNIVNVNFAIPSSIKYVAQHKKQSNFTRKRSIELQIRETSKHEDSHEYPIFTNTQLAYLNNYCNRSRIYQLLHGKVNMQQFFANYEYIKNSLASTRLLEDQKLIGELQVQMLKEGDRLSNHGNHLTKKELMLNYDKYIEEVLFERKINDIRSRPISAHYEQVEEVIASHESKMM